MCTRNATASIRSIAIESALPAVSRLVQGRTEAKIGGGKSFVLREHEPENLGREQEEDELKRQTMGPMMIRRSTCGRGISLVVAMQQRMRRTVSGWEWRAKKSRVCVAVDGIGGRIQVGNEYYCTYGTRETRLLVIAP